MGISWGFHGDFMYLHMIYIYMVCIWLNAGKARINFSHMFLFFVHPLMGDLGMVCALLLLIGIQKWRYSVTV